MKCYGLTLNLKDDADSIEKYKEYHRHPWPEPLQGLRVVGDPHGKRGSIGW